MVPPAKRAKAAAPHVKPFNCLHQLEYGLLISQRDAGTSKVVSVSCRFCIAFGRECKVGPKRNTTSNLKTFGPVFRPENYRIHLNSEHSTKWEAYCALSPELKGSYFDGIPFTNTIISHLERGCDAVVYTIDKDIVDIIIGDILWNPNDIDGLTYENAMRLF